MMNLLPNTSQVPSVSLCMIVKNEAANLPRCLASVKPYVDEMIVVDTGSTDNTVEIAQQYGAKVSYFEWCDDFAAARNYSISQATKDWILVLDADEELIVPPEGLLEQLTESSQYIIYLLALIDSYHKSWAPCWLPRLFRNIPELKYVEKFHEQPVYHNQEFTTVAIPLKDVKVLHYGYEIELSMQKALNRNIPLLERLQEQETLSFILLYCLAAMYAGTKQIEKSNKCYTEAFERLLPYVIQGDKPESFFYVPTIICHLGMQSISQQDYETGGLLIQRGLEWCPNHPCLNVLAGAILKAWGFPLGAIAYLKKALQLGREESYYKWEAFDVSYMTTIPAYDLGCIYIDLEQPEEALTAFELALSFDPNFITAQEKVEKIKQYLAL